MVGLRQRAMGCGDDGVNISEEEESPDEGVNPLGCSIRKLLQDECSYSFTKPPDTVRDTVYCLLQPLENSDDQVL